MASNFATLPPALRDKFQSLLRRIRLARWLRGCSYLIGILIIVFTTAFLADWWLGLTNSVLRVWFLALILGGAAVTAVSLVVPLSRRLPARVLAGLIEKQYPDLRERLTSAVELNEQHQQAHGAEALIALVCADAAQRTAALDLAPVYSVAPAKGRLALALSLLLLALVPAFVSTGYIYFGQRFLRCWFSPLVGYALKVAPANAALAKGRPATIHVRLVSEDARVPLPKTCFLVLADAMEKPARQAMQAEGEHFTFTMEKLPGDLTYRIETGELISDEFRLTAVDPVELVQGSPVIQVTPPPYVNKEVHPVETNAVGADFAALQFSMVRVDFRFNRPPLAVHLHTKEAGEEKLSELALQWRQTSQEAFALIPANKVGSFSATLIMEAEHGITTVRGLPHWKVWPDEAPVFTQLPHVPVPSAGWSHPENARPASPHDAVALRATLADQVGIERLEVEYRVNDRPSVFEELAKGHGKLVLHSEAAFKLVGKVKEGDVLRFRLRAWDNRRLAMGAVAAGVPERALDPHVVHEPVQKDGQDQWYLLKITSQAEPLHKQEIVAQRDDIRRLVEAIKKKLSQERGQLEKVSLAARGQPFLTPETTRALGRARAMNADIVQDLALLGRQAMAEPALLVLAERAFDIAESELGRSDRNLARAEEKQLVAALREEQLQQAGQELLRALVRLEEFTGVNERLAQDRLDQWRMEQLALQQEDLGKRAKKLAANNLDTNKASQDELALLRAEQDKIAQELDRLAEQSQLFRESLQRFRAGQAKQLAQKAHDLAQSQRDLSDAGQESLLRELKSRLAELARKQKDLAGRSEQLGLDARGKRSEPHFPEAKEAAEALAQARVVFALQAQEKTQGDLLRLAGDLERTILLGKSPREAALKLARVQERLRKDLEQVSERLASLTQKQVRALLLEILAAQQKLVEALPRLEIPANLPAAQGARTQANDLVRQVEDYLKTRDGLATFNKMEEAVDALRHLAGTLPETQPASATAKESPEEVAARQRALKARELAREQRDLQEAVRKILDEVLEAQKAQQYPRQKELEKEVENLAGELMKLAQKPGGPMGMHGAEEAAQAAQDAKKAQDAMKTERFNLDQAKEAARTLDLAAQKADQAADKMQAASKSGAENDIRDMTGKAFNEGQEQVEQSQNQLKGGPGAETQKAMQQAARALQNAAQAAAQQMARTSSPTGQGKAKSLAPGQVGAAPGGLPTPQLLAKELAKYPGKSWGELPGELRTRIVQDLRARYGDDYAPIIQRYFQQIADVPMNKR